MNDYIEQRLNQAVAKHELYATEGAAFGPLLGTSFTFPKKPEFWTLAELDALRSAQLDRAEGQAREQLSRMWQRVLASRLTMLGEYYPLRQHPFIPTPEAVKAEFLALEPAIARPALAQAVDWSHHELALAGHDLYWALDALLAVAATPGKSLPSMPCRTDIPLDPSRVMEMPVGSACAWPLGVNVTHATKTHYAVELGGLAPLHPDVQPDAGIWVTTQAGQGALQNFLAALRVFCQESLLARVMIGITTPGGCLSLDSRPLEGILVNRERPARMLALAREEHGVVGLRSVSVAVADARTTSLPEDANDRNALVEEVLAQWGSTLQAFPFSFECHIAFIAPLADPLKPLSMDEKAVMLAHAKATYPVVEEHVRELEEGGYLVTRHDMISPVPLAVTDDVEFAIRLALAHEVSNPWRLGLKTRLSAA